MAQEYTKGVFSLVNSEHMSPPRSLRDMVIVGSCRGRFTAITLISWPCRLSQNVFGSHRDWYVFMTTVLYVDTTYFGFTPDACFVAYICTTRLSTITPDVHLSLFFLGAAGEMLSTCLITARSPCGVQ